MYVELCRQIVIPLIVHMLQNVPISVSAVAGTIVLYLLWSNHNLQFQLASHLQAEEGLAGELDLAKARYVQIEVGVC